MASSFGVGVKAAMIDATLITAVAMFASCMISISYTPADSKDASYALITSAVCTTAQIAWTSADSLL